MAPHLSLRNWSWDSDGSVLSHTYIPLVLCLNLNLISAPQRLDWGSQDPFIQALFLRFAFLHREAGNPGSRGHMLTTQPQPGLRVLPFCLACLLAGSMAEEVLSTATGVAISVCFKIWSQPGLYKNHDFWFHLKNWKIKPYPLFHKAVTTQVRWQLSYEEVGCLLSSSHKFPSIDHLACSWIWDSDLLTSLDKIGDALGHMYRDRPCHFWWSSWVSHVFWTSLGALGPLISFHPWNEDKSWCLPRACAALTLQPQGLSCDLGSSGGWTA